MTDPSLTQRIPLLGHRASIAVLRLLADAPVSERRSGDGWFAVRTGVDSNDLNGVVSDSDAVLREPMIRELVSWVTADDRPASWLTTEPDPSIAAMLVSAGAHPERTGNWCGAELSALDLTAATNAEVVPVRDDRELDAWLDLADACGWLGVDDRDPRAGLYRSVGLTGPLQHWVARLDGMPVGFASALFDGDTVALCNLGVLDSHRRRGIGRALALHRLRIGRDLDATHAVAAPSQDGWQLLRTIGLTLAPVVPDVCFYLTPAPR